MYRKRDKSPTIEKNFNLFLQSWFTALDSWGHARRKANSQTGWGKRGTLGEKRPVLKMKDLRRMREILSQMEFDSLPASTSFERKKTEEDLNDALEKASQLFDSERNLESP